MAAENYRSAELFLAGLSTDRVPGGQTSSADEFLDAALRWFGDPDRAPRNGVGEGRKISQVRRASPNPTGSGRP